MANLYFALFLYLNLLKSAFSSTADVNGKLFAARNSSQSEYSSSFISLSMSPSLQYSTFSTHPSHITVKDASLTEAHLGNYIAVGLGFPNPSGGLSPATTTRAGDFTSIGASTSKIINGTPSDPRKGTHELNGYSSNLSHKIVTSASFTTAPADFPFEPEVCSSYWPTFRVANSSANVVQVVTHSTTAVSTFAWTKIASYPANLASKWTVERTHDYTRMTLAKGYNDTTTNIKATETETETTLSKPGSTRTGTHTDTSSDGSSPHATTASHFNVTTPTCTLPLSVCQSYASLCSALSADRNPITLPLVLTAALSAAMPLNPFTSQIPAQPTSSSRQYLPSRIKNPLVHSSSQGQNPSPHTGIPFETGPDRSSPPTHDPVPNGSVTKSADSHVPTTNPNVTPTLRGGPVKSNAATVGTDDGPPTKIPSVSVADPTAIIPIIVEGSRSGPGNNPAGGLPGTTTENPGNSISSEPHRAPENPGDHAGSAIAHIIGGHDTTAPAGPFLTSEFPNPKATSSGNVYGVSNGGPPAAPGTSFETAPIEMGGRHHSVIPSNGGDPTISSLPVIGGLTVAVNPVVSGGILIGHHSIARGGATTIAGTAVINGPHGAVVRASSTISSLSPGQTATIDSQTVIADASGKLVIGGSSIARGDATTVDGNVISNGFDGIVVGTSYTISVPSPAPVAPTDAKEASAVPTALFTLLGQTYIAKSGGPLVVDGKTLSPGNSATNVDGQTISVGSSGVVVYGSTIAYSAATDSILDVPATDIASSSDSIPDVTGSKTNPTAIFSFGSAREEMTYTDASGHVHTAVEGAVGGGTAIVDGSVTLTVGGRGTILEAETLSLASMGLVVNGSTKRFATAAVPSDPTSVISTLGVPDLPSGVDPTQTDTFSTAVKFELSCTWHLFILLYCVAFFAVNL